MAPLQTSFDYGSLSKTRVLERYKIFKEGREPVKDEPRSNRLSTSTDERQVA